jgi:hypothetical protein
MVIKYDLKWINLLYIREIVVVLNLHSNGIRDECVSKNATILLLFNYCTILSVAL